MIKMGRAYLIYELYELLEVPRYDFLCNESNAMAVHDSLEIIQKLSNSQIDLR
jgi:hypothetical protein